MSQSIPLTESTRSKADRPWRVAVIAGSILLVELAFIRLIPAEVRAISYFRNLILMAAFMGLGVGCILQDSRSIELLLPIGLVTLASLMLIGRGIVIYPQSSEVHYWLIYGEMHERPQLPLSLAAGLLFVSCSIPFAALGQSLAREMSRHERLPAYGWDLAGSLAGVLIFVLASALRLPPWIWPCIVMAVWSLFFVRTALWRLFYASAGLIFLCFSFSHQQSLWSPYYLVQYERTPVGTRVFVNSGFHQFGFDFSAQSKDWSPILDEIVKKWTVPYDAYRAENQGRNPKRVLVLGAGTGNDVAIALANGASQVTAVEIDPVIVEIGRQSNAKWLFADSRVEFHIGDARRFLRTGNHRFDMIIFGTLDSQILLAAQGNIRLDNYVYTRESLADARRLLTDRGIAAVFYSVQKDWLYERIYSTFRAAFGDQSRMYFYHNQDLFNTVLLGTKENPAFRDSGQMVRQFGRGMIATDDWPFVYLRRPSVGGMYGTLIVVVLLLVLIAFILLRSRQPTDAVCSDFLLLGAGFALLESVAIVRMALLFGSTWSIHAVVFSAVLVTMFLANLAVLRDKAPPQRLCWAALLLALVLNYLFPLQIMLSMRTPVRIIASMFFVGGPVFFASVCFSRLFRRQPQVGYPLGVNLLGTMIGGWIEYLSMILGIRTIWLILLAIYSGAWMASEWQAQTAHSQNGNVGGSNSPRTAQIDSALSQESL